MVGRNLNNVFDQYLFLVVLGKFHVFKSTFYILLIFTVRKRSLRRLCFHRCLSVHRGVSISVQGGLHPVGGGESPSRGVSVQGCLCPEGVSARGGGPCPRGISGRPPDRDPPPYSNELVVHILLKYILVLLLFTRSYEAQSTKPHITCFIFS